MKSYSLSMSLLSLCLFVATIAFYNVDSIDASVTKVLQKPNIHYRMIVKRDAEQHSVMHNHLSRKVFERACAASKDSIDEIMACVTTNEHIMKAVDEKVAAGCYKDAFGQDFDPKDMHKHKELICKNRDKFEIMTACIYRKTAENMDTKQMEKLTESMVDVGLCIINALDG